MTAAASTKTSLSPKTIGGRTTPKPKKRLSLFAVARAAAREASSAAPTSASPTTALSQNRATDSSAAAPPAAPPDSNPSFIIDTSVSTMTKARSDSASSVSPTTATHPTSTSGAGSLSGSGAGGISSRKRVRNFTPDDRAAHRIFEKSRREAFKGHLTDLARLVPCLVDVDPKRLSKHAVVQESIARHRLQQKRCESVLDHVKALLQERDHLLEEVNKWRAGQYVHSPANEVMMRPITSAEAFRPILDMEEEDAMARKQQRKSMYGTTNVAPTLTDLSSKSGAGQASNPCTGASTLGNTHFSSSSSDEGRNSEPPTTAASAASIIASTLGTTTDGKNKYVILPTNPLSGMEHDLSMDVQGNDSIGSPDSSHSSFRNLHINTNTSANVPPPMDPMTMSAHPHDTSASAITVHSTHSMFPEIVSATAASAQSGMFPFFPDQSSQLPPSMDQQQHHQPQQQQQQQQHQQTATGMVENNGIEMALVGNVPMYHLTSQHPGSSFSLPMDSSSLPFGAPLHLEPAANQPSQRDSTFPGVHFIPPSQAAPSSAHPHRQPSNPSQQSPPQYTQPQHHPLQPHSDLRHGSTTMSSAPSSLAPTESDLLPALQASTDHMAPSSVPSDLDMAMGFYPVDSATMAMPMHGGAMAHGVGEPDKTWHVSYYDVQLSTLG